MNVSVRWVLVQALVSLHDVPCSVVKAPYHSFLSSRVLGGET